MRKNPEVLGLILARGGSKAIPRKNIRELNGRPLMAYVIQQALQSQYLNGVYVSSDDDEILDIARQLGALPLKRPYELAQDDSKSIDAIQHFIKNVECHIIVLLNACCPLTKADDIDGIIKLALETGVDSVTSLVEDFSSHPSKVCYLENGRIVGLGETFESGERQKQAKIYKRNTAIYLASRELIEQGKLFSENTQGYIMPKERSWDINDMFDWKIAEFLIKSIESIESIKSR